MLCPPSTSRAAECESVGECRHAGALLAADRSADVPASLSSPRTTARPEATAEPTVWKAFLLQEQTRMKRILRTAAAGLLTWDIGKDSGAKVELADSQVGHQGCEGVGCHLGLSCRQQVTGRSDCRRGWAKGGLPGSSRGGRPCRQCHKLGVLRSSLANGATTRKCLQAGCHQASTLEKIRPKSGGAQGKVGAC